ncbi:MAG TPA: PIN domain-containing protein [Gemmatimonadaceae bacterium]|nr:PIN domain-containing protein [Gemmatimonadaceae bacterium]
MSVGYVDTSCLVAIAFGERGATALARRLGRFEELVASNLLEAELRAAFLREQVEGPEALLESVSWISPERPLSAEIARVLSAGYVRGADCWHLATALYVAPEPGELTFVTLDARQREVAAVLGFAV